MKDIEMKNMILIMAAIVTCMLASANHAVAREDLVLILSPVAGADGGIDLRLTLENGGNTAVRVLLPAFWQGGGFRPDTLIGGYSLRFVDPDGRPADIDWGPASPSAPPHPPRVDESLVLRPGMSVGMRLRLSTKLTDLADVSRVVACYEIHKQPVSSKDWKDVKPRLWLGKITSSPFILPKRQNPKPQ